MKTIFILIITLSFITNEVIYSQDEVNQDVKFYNKNLITSGSIYALAVLEAFFFPVGESPKPLKISYKNSYRNPLLVRTYSNSYYEGSSQSDQYGMYSRKIVTNMEVEECYVGKFNVSKARLQERNVQYYDLKQAYDYERRKDFKKRITIMTAGIATLFFGGSIKIVEVGYGTGEGIKQNVTLAKIIRVSSYVIGGILIAAGFLPKSNSGRSEIEKVWEKYEKKYKAKYSINLKPVILESIVFKKSDEKEIIHSYGINFNLTF